MIVVNCTTEEYHNLIEAFEGSICCPFKNNPKIKCTLDYTQKLIEGEAEATCIPCLKKNIVWIIED